MTTWKWVETQTSVRADVYRIDHALTARDNLERANGGHRAR